MKVRSDSKKELEKSARRFSRAMKRLAKDERNPTGRKTDLPANPYEEDGK